MLLPQSWRLSSRRCSRSTNHRDRHPTAGVRNSASRTRAHRCDLAATVSENATLRTAPGSRRTSSCTKLNRSNRSFRCTRWIRLPGPGLPASRTQHLVPYRPPAIKTVAVDRSLRWPALSWVVPLGIEVHRTRTAQAAGLGQGASTSRSHPTVPPLPARPDRRCRKTSGSECSDAGAEP